MLRTKPTILQGALVVALAAGTTPVSATATPPRAVSCSNANSDARTLTDYPAEWPAIGRLLQASGKAVVKVDLSESGSVRAAVIVQSSGNPWLDVAAKEATVAQRYSAEVRNCTAVAGSYLFEVDFKQ